MKERKIFLSGKNITLCEMIEDDQESFQGWLAGNPELRSLIDDDSIPTIEDQLRWFERSKKSDRKMFSLFTLDDILIGHGGFVDIAPDSAHLRITIGNPEYWGRGIGTEATRLLVQYGFEKMHCAFIWLRVLASNERAVKSYTKVGFDRWKAGETGKERKKRVMRMRIFASV